MKRRKVLYISLTVLISAISILLGFLVFSNSYLRLKEAIIDLLGSFRYYFRTLFELPNKDLPGVTRYSEVMVWDTLLPTDFETFKANVSAFFNALFSKENFQAWSKEFGVKMGDAAKIITLLLPCVLSVILVIRQIYAAGNNRYNVDTKMLLLFKRISEKTYQPLKRFVLGYIKFLKEHSKIWISLLFVWALHFNFVSIVIEFLAYYFFFASAFKVDTLYIQFVKLVLDLQMFLRFFPKWLLVIIGYLIFDYFRRKMALARLRHYEARNCGFINDLPIVSITCGSMGKKKTTMISDMTLSQEVMFRQKAFEILQKADMKFPYFPWICFENELLKCMEYGVVYNLVTAKEWVKLKRSRYAKHSNNDWQLYGYDTERYGLLYDDKLKVSHLFDVLETYAQAYLIYAVQTSLIVSNYSIRTDNQIMTEGNFPLWALDFFSDGKRDSRHAHILDFDVLRLGKKIIENNPKAGSFEFGVIAITEIGKERGNNLELKEVKKKNDETNQKNDLFNSWLKMCRHSATVDNFPFIKVFTDEQRPESWGADARDLCDIVNIASAGDQRLALPFYTIEEMLSEMAFNRFIALYYDFRYRRGDNTLLVHILKTITSVLWKRNARIYNKYGFSVLKIEKERGTMDGEPENKRYYLMNRKIYSRRFTTDCFSDYFNDMAKKTNVGLMDYIEYETEKASVEELKMQNSYFINSLYKCNEEDSVS